MRILGVDPGLANVGLGLVEMNGKKLEYVEHRCIVTDKEVDVCQRLRQLYDQLCQTLEDLEPDIVAVETLYLAKNAKTAMGVSQARGVALMALAGRNVELVELTPMQIKMSLVGYGKADKKQVQMMVQQLLGLKELPRPDHAADALAAAISCANMRGMAKIVGK